MRLLLSILLFSLLIGTPPASAAAAEPYAAYPPLPAGYSSIRVFDNQGRYAGRILPEKRYWVTLDRIPSFLQKAVVAVEDSRFYEHSGIDMRGIARAVVKDVVKRRLAEGGSTITQQLIKNRYLTGEKSIDRKLKEGVMALEFEKKYTKRQILEMYLNEIYYGNGAWGIAQAARLYFDKNPDELTDAECAQLAGVPKNPGRYNPLGTASAVVGRRDVVLKRMLDVGAITTQQQTYLRANPAPVVQPPVAQQYLAMVRTTLVERLGAGVVEQGGLEVATAMDLPLQKQAERALTEGVRRISPRLQGALLCINPANGDILAAVGGTDYPKNPLNRALAARRQPGSAIKPLIYAAALEKGIPAASIWSDAPVAYNRGAAGEWIPRNYDGKTHGAMSLRQALASSNNVIAVKLLDTVGSDTFAEYAGKAGLMLRNRNDLSAALGTEEVTLRELVAAYTPFANGGVWHEPRIITRVYDRTRKTWHESPSAAAQAMTPEAAFVVSSMLRDVLTQGTARNLRSFALKRPMAGKTGTTSDYRDAWFVGYTPHLVAGVWLGHDKPKPGGKGFTGGAVAAPIWQRFMQGALAGREPIDFTRPDKVTSVAIDPSTGLLATPLCPDTKEELFITGTEPAGVCPQHGLQPPGEKSSQ